MEQVSIEGREKDGGDGQHVGGEGTSLQSDMGRRAMMWKVSVETGEIDYENVVEWM